MRKFRFIGDSTKVGTEIYYKFLVNGNIYEEDHLLHVDGDWREYKVIDLASKYYWPEDWEEVFDEPTKPLHKDTDLGYFAGQVLQGILSALSDTDGMKFYQKWSGGNKSQNGEKLIQESFCELSINIAKELIKQLDQEIK